MSKIDVTQKADIRAIMGASGTGKSHYTKAELAKAKRVLIWDIEDEYEDIEVVTIQNLALKLHSIGDKPFKLRVFCQKASERDFQFDLTCRAAMAQGNMLFIAEELRFVTEPSRAPDGWADITLRGRKRGIKVIGTSQRPASIDKDFLSNATMIRCGAMGFPADRKAVAGVMGIDPAEIEKLEGYQAILWTRTPRSVKRV